MSYHTYTRRRGALVRRGAPRPGRYSSRPIFAAPNVHLARRAAAGQGRALKRARVRRWAAAAVAIIMAWAYSTL